MRAAEILADLVLNEADSRVYAITFGPNIPKFGYWVSGGSFDDIVKKVLAGTDQQSPNALAEFIANNYSMVTDANGRIDVYGFQIPRLTAKAVQMLGIYGDTPVFYHSGVDSPPEQMTGQDAFGVTEPTPQQLQPKQQSQQQQQPPPLPGQKPPVIQPQAQKQPPKVSPPPRQGRRAQWAPDPAELDAFTQGVNTRAQGITRQANQARAQQMDQLYQQALDAGFTHDDAVELVKLHYGEL